MPHGKPYFLGLRVGTYEGERGSIDEALGMCVLLW